MACGFETIAFGKVFALKRHAVLNGNAAAQRFDTVDVALRHRFSMVKEPVQAVEWDITIHLFEYVEHTAYRFVIGGMQAEWPAMFNQVANHALQLIFHAWRQVRTRLQKVFKVGGGEHQHFTRAVVTKVVAALARRQHVGPLFKVFQLVAGTLREEVVGDTNCHLLFLVQFGDHLVIFRVVLETAARVDGAGQAETVQLTHKLTRGVNLLLKRQSGTFCQRGVEDHGVGTRNQHAGRVAVAVTLDFAARRIGRVAGVAYYLERRAIKQGAIIEMQHKYRRIGRGLIDFIQRWHTTLGKLKFGPAANDAHPLRRRRAQRLRFQHAQRVGDRRHTFPAQLKVIVETAANQMQVRIVETGNSGVTFEVNDLCAVAVVLHNIIKAAHLKKLTVANGDRVRQWVFTIHRMKATIGKNDVCFAQRNHNLSFNQ